ncbi:MAG: HNH endonuclease [Bdellovibrio sp.]|nr:HNH endonuclease [Bdellovibrio sp.]
MIHLSNNQLLEKVKDLVQQERRIQADFLLHLREVETRRLYLEIGYGSLFDYVSKELGYSESAAYRRIQAMRLLKAVPEVEHKISSGEITLTTAAQVQSFIRTETKREGNVSLDCKRDLVAAIQNKSTREVEKILIAQSSETALPTERVRLLTETHTEVRLVIDEQLQKKLDQLKHLLSHQNHDMNYAQLIGIMADRELKRSDLAVKKCRNTATPAPKLGMAKKHSRYISTRVRQFVWKRDQGCCSYVSADGKKCGSRHQVQFDHIQQYSKGGEHSSDNLRLLCGSHNRFRN